MKKVITYDDLRKANESIKNTNIKGKAYAEVNQRIKAFRMLYPEGTISTRMTSNENGVCIFTAEIYTDEHVLLATGTAYEKENSTFINKTSYIENCETSAIGRALGIAGFGIDTSIASAEEVQNAINNQGDPKEKLILMNELNNLMDTKNIDREKLYKHYKVNSNADMTEAQLKDAIERLKEK